MTKRALLTLLTCGAMFCAAQAHAEMGEDAPVASHARPANAYEAEAFTDHSVGEMKDYRTKYEDTLVQVARDNKLGFVELRSANPFVDPWLPGDGTKMILPTMHLLPDAPHSDIVINLPDFRLYAYLKKNQGPYNFPIGVGRDGLNTPMGTTQVMRKVVGPVWRPTPRMRREKPELPAAVGPGVDNPMGTHAMYLGWPEYAIHGTNKPFGIGRRTSSGCIRMYPEDIITLYNMVPAGTKVTVVNQPVKAAWVGNTFYIEAHASLAQADKLEAEGGLPDYELTDQDMALIVAAAGDQIDRLDWKKVRKLVRDRQGYPIAVATRSSGENIASAGTHEPATAVADDQPIMSPIDVKKADAPQEMTSSEDESASTDAKADEAKTDDQPEDQAQRAEAAEKQVRSMKPENLQKSAAKKKSSGSTEKADAAGKKAARNFQRNDSDDRSSSTAVKSSQDATEQEPAAAKPKEREHNS